ncbi:DUF1287 domain-containing protein [Planctomycetota bacterium]
MRISVFVLIVAIIFGSISLSYHLLSSPKANYKHNTQESVSQKSVKAQQNPLENLDPFTRKVVKGALHRAEKGTRYDAAYISLTYPGGDVPDDRGACTDVIIRSFRNADVDFQKLIHEDMKARFAQYPQNWGLRKPDRNIDHRRIPNLLCFLDKYGKKLSASISPEHLNEWQAGDMVFWDLGRGILHCGVIVMDKNAKKFPLVVHNIGICRKDDCLERWPIVGHYRYKPTN